MTTYPAIEHRGSRVGRWLRARRLRLALLVGALETILIVFTDATWRWALLLALVVFLFYFFVGRRTQSDLVRQASWTAAASQVMPVVVPVVIFVIGTLFVLAVVALAVAMLVLLFLDRR